MNEQEFIAQMTGDMTTIQVSFEYDEASPAEIMPDGAPVQIDLADGTRFAGEYVGRPVRREVWDPQAGEYVTCFKTKVRILERLPDHCLAWKVWRWLRNPRWHWQRARATAREARNGGVG